MSRIHDDLAAALLKLTADRDDSQSAGIVSRFAAHVRRRYGLSALTGTLRALPAAARKAAGIREILVETARPLPDAVIREALAGLKMDPDRSEVRTAVRPELVGGMRIRCGGTLIDASIRRQLDKLSQAGR